METFDKALEREIPRLRRYARALTREVTKADDLVQSALLRAWTKRHLWQEGTDLRAWLFTILHNQYVNDIRKVAREGQAVGVSDSLPAFDRADATVENEDLEMALGLLPSDQREVIEFVGLDELRYEEVAQLLGIPVGTVRSRLSRGRELLRKLLQGVSVNEPGYKGETLKSITARSALKTPQRIQQPIILDEWPEELVDEY